MENNLTVLGYIDAEKHPSGALPLKFSIQILTIGVAISEIFDSV